MTPVPAQTTIHLRRAQVALAPEELLNLLRVPHFREVLRAALPGTSLHVRYAGRLIAGPFTLHDLQSRPADGSEGGVALDIVLPGEGRLDLITVHGRGPVTLLCAMELAFSYEPAAAHASGAQTGVLQKRLWPMRIHRVRP